MRTTLTLAEDAVIAARHLAQRQRLSLGEAVSELVRRGAAAVPDSGPAAGHGQALRGRFALLPQREEVVTPQHVRKLMEQEGI